jgi:alkanesulfonate monooxygenase SsuD/methylene tetrahydromethanopterin reductase-like flavin-dependent oxidoreductase (luciferase family)
VSVADAVEKAKKHVDRFAIEYGDAQACENHFQEGWAGFPLVGTPQMMVDHLGMLTEAGVDGVCLSWLDYNSGIKQWNAEVMPLLEKAGLRQPYTPQ